MDAWDEVASFGLAGFGGAALGAAAGSAGAAWPWLFGVLGAVAFGGSAAVTLRTRRRSAAASTAAAAPVATAPVSATVDQQENLTRQARQD
jgi:hypothetical protein